MTHDDKNYKEIMEILTEIKMQKGWTNTTLKNYKNILLSYTRYHTETIKALLNEADAEEEDRIRMKHRKIKQRILTYRQHLIDDGKQVSTINRYVSAILTFYTLNEIEPPRITGLTNRTHETIEDIPTRKHIKQALENTGNTQLQAMILFLSSSGCSRTEMINITVQDFIDATKEYHNETQLQNVLNVLKRRDDVIPMFHLVRQKTNYPYYCFCTNEATQKIILHLEQRLSRKELQPTDSLWTMKKESVTDLFNALNNRMGWGYVNTHGFFHPHALRKYFATQLLKADCDAMTIDFLSGRHINTTQEAYFKADPLKLKNKYMYYMHNLSIREHNQYTSINSKEKEELKALKLEREMDKQRLRDVERKLEVLLRQTRL